MKASLRTMSAAVFFAVFACFYLGIFSVGEVYSEDLSFGTRLESEEGVYSFDLGDGFYWSYNEKTEALTIKGKGDFPYSLGQSVKNASFNDGGNTILDVASKVLKDVYPHLDITLSMPDEANRRVGQSIAAAMMPQVK